MFARTVPSGTQAIQFVLAACKKYDWKQTVIIFNVRLAEVGNSAERALLAAGVTVVMDLAVEDKGFVSPALPELRRKSVRIVICMPQVTGDLRQWLLDFFDAGMTGLGWAFLAGLRINDENLGDLKGSNTWMGEDNRDADVMKAANGMIASTPAPPASMVGLVGLLQKAALWDMQEYGAEALPLSQWSGSNAVYAGFAYDALQALAIAADAEIRAGGDAANGTSLMQRLLDGTTFDGVMGRVSLDNQGDNMHPW